MMERAGIILASGSTSRRTLLAAAGVGFSTVAPVIDEESVKAALIADGAGPGELADRLAEKKALGVSEGHAGSLVIGADQVLVCESRLFNKALDADAARRTLEALSGKAHELISAIVVARAGAPIWRHSDTATLWMRDLSREFLDAYLAAELPDVLGSVGCYRIEGRGAQLFARVSGDYFSIRGLPLIPLLEALRRFGGLAR